MPSAVVYRRARAGLPGRLNVRRRSGAGRFVRTSSGSDTRSERVGAIQFADQSAGDSRPISNSPAGLQCGPRIRYVRRSRSLHAIGIPHRCGPLGARLAYIEYLNLTGDLSCTRSVANQLPPEAWSRGIDAQWVSTALDRQIGDGDRATRACLGGPGGCIRKSHVEYLSSPGATGSWPAVA